jgi:hypothetical protein
MDSENGGCPPVMNARRQFKFHFAGSSRETSSRSRSECFFPQKRRAPSTTSYNGSFMQKSILSFDIVYVLFKLIVGDTAMRCFCT